ncbi:MULTISPECIES: glycosyltransferase family 2 protein [Klebsiella pneumoniae complex]|uniref:glycosyltransferase family 2 protein n=1 Tax=Klebsiella pneumoniae complex TaxID=3390273 RepID=UPI001FCB5941|nr:glycosyltransferase [Klebsiella variicola]MCJ6069329.1 glycosyltransferase family 2 protein [Klebsiella variicola]HDK6468045.1 glycosyltransferase [Klebsiella variicola]
MKAYIAIPTYNGGSIWEESAQKIREYAPVGTYVQIIDSGSKDNTVSIAKKYEFDVMHIDAKNFNHGGTRNLLVELHKDEFEIVIFLTQDAIPEPNFFEKITGVFSNAKIACAYGRQLPHYDANAISQHARYFNYREDGYISKFDDIPLMGLKTVFSSNSFSAYRISTFLELNGFPKNTILSEDMHYAAKSVLAGYSIAYVSDSIVRHSHNYNCLEEFKRYFDIGVFHADESWIRAKFGGAGGEGKRFIYSEFIFLLKNSPLSIPSSILHNILKILGYKLGQHYKFLPKKIVKNLSMHRKFWG